MTDAGYFAKRVMARPEWLVAPGVAEICSASTCISQAPEGWIDPWIHNELGWFIVGAIRFSIEQPEPGDYYVLEVLEEGSTA